MCRWAVLILIAVIATHAGAEKPNIVLIYADDLGFGDVSCNGATLVRTPNIDRIANEGLRFTDAHSSAATCTPSRFALMTGQYAFRRKGTGVLPGDANLIIEPGTVTLPGLLKSAGYATGVVGKWHLGLGRGGVDWNGKIEPGPNEIGFDYHFIMPATGDRVPCVYVEQGRVVDLDPADPIHVSYQERIDDGPSGKEQTDVLKQKWSHGHNFSIVNDISRIGWMTGGQKARWIDEDMADVFTMQAVKFIAEHRDKPFFLYFATHDIHVPRVPHARFVGKTPMGPRGDAIAQFDWCVGEVAKALDEFGLADNTLLIVTSDNGPVLDDGYVDEANERLGGHSPSGLYRGGKYSLFEGATRVPFVVRWPGRVPKGKASDALFGQIDLATSLAALVGVAIPAGGCPDGENHLPALLGMDEVGRSQLIHESRRPALRLGKWKYIPPGPSGDQLGPWTQVKIEEPGALYDLSVDPGETRDLSASNRDRVKEIADLLQRLREAR